MPFPFVRLSEHVALQVECDALRAELRAAEDRAEALGDRALRAAVSGQREIEAYRAAESSRSKTLTDAWAKAIDDANARATSAEQRAADAVALTQKVLAEARGLMTEAMNMSKLAATALFGLQIEGDMENGPSVATSNRAAAMRMREDLEQGKR
ncbi:MAG: hypothetical protein JWM41_2887 [Gemmatimonadetes bacterium]|nr:hypothetical protein [Gemmatimonadota bacterium]